MAGSGAGAKIVDMMKKGFEVEVEVEVQDSGFAGVAGFRE